MTTPVRMLLVALLGIAAAAVTVAQPPVDLPPGEMLRRADTDGDGSVSRDEFLKARTAMLEERFTRMDTDGDGKLDEQEAKAAAEQMRPAPGGREGFRRPDGPRPPRPEGERPPRPDGERGPRADGERPARPDRERPPRPEGERPRRPGGGAGAGEAFDRFDADGDGQLSREEFADGMARMRELMQRDGPGGPGVPGGPGPGGRGPEQGFRRPPPQD